MFIKGSLREYERTPVIKPLRYTVSVMNTGELKKINNIAVSVDISSEGIGMLTDFPLEKGQLLTFEEMIKVNNIESKKAAVVKWTGRINGKYRGGLKFV